MSAYYYLRCEPFAINAYEYEHACLIALKFALERDLEPEIEIAAFLFELAHQRRIDLEASHFGVERDFWETGKELESIGYRPKGD